MSRRAIAFDGKKFVALKKARLPFTDLAIVRGAAFFESLRTFDRQPFTLQERCKRICRSAKMVGFRLTFGVKDIERLILTGMKRVPGKELLIKIVLTAGDGSRLVPEGPARLLLYLAPFSLPPKRKVERGIKLITKRYQRIFPEFKTTTYLAAVIGQIEAEKRGYDDVLYLDEGKRVLEGTSFNFGIIRHRELITPYQSVLRGFTMQVVKRIAPRLGLKVVSRPIPYSELCRADEAFVTSTVRSVMPVVKIDKLKIGFGKPGPMTRALLSGYEQYARNKSAKIS